MKQKIDMFIFKAVAVFALLLPLLGDASVNAAEHPKIGIAWRADTDSEFLTNVWRAIEQAGGEPILLPQVKAPYLEYEGAKLLPVHVDKNDYLNASSAALIKEKGCSGSNAAEAVKGVRAVVFTGGEDISPTLCKTVEPWHGIMEEKDYNAERDVSDYLLMRFCIDNNIPILGLCRGMQMLSVVCGASVIQDIPTYMAELGKQYDYLHRRQKSCPEEYRDYMPHEVQLLSGSKLSRIFAATHLKAVPSWHHQAVRSVDGTPLNVAAITMTDNLPIIEAVELPEKIFAVGLQFHPEAAVAKELDKKENRSSFMSYEVGLKVFRELVNVNAAKSGTAPARHY